MRLKKKEFSIENSRKIYYNCVINHFLDLDMKEKI